MSLKDGAAASHLPAHKNPIPTEPSFGLVAKVNSSDSVGSHRRLRADLTSCAIDLRRDGRELEDDGRARVCRRAGRDEVRLPFPDQCEDAADQYEPRSDDSWSTGLEDPSSAEASESLLTVPALHVLFSLPAPRPSEPELPSSTDSRAVLRTELVDYLASSLGGDRDAAEWLLLALVARM